MIPWLGFDPAYKAMANEFELENPQAVIGKEFTHLDTLDRILDEKRLVIIVSELFGAGNVNLPESVRLDDGAGIAIEGIKRIKLSTTNSQTPIIVYRGFDYVEGQTLTRRRSEYLDAGARDVYVANNYSGFKSLERFAKTISLYLNSK